MNKQARFISASILVLSISLLLCLFCFAFPETASAEGPFKGSGTAASPYLIETAEQLYTLPDICAASPEYLSAHYRLNADITLNSGTFSVDKASFSEAYQSSPVTAWSPIGTSEHPFCGVFDGAHHVITGLYSDDVLHASMFGVNNGVIKNIVFENCMTYGDGSALVASVNMSSGVIDSIATVGGAVVSTTFGGGIVAENHGTIVNCMNGAPIYVYSGVGGGIAGSNDGRILNFANDASLIARNNECVLAGVAGIQNAGGVMIGGYSHAIFFKGKVSGYRDHAFGITSKYADESHIRSVYWYYEHLKGGVLTAADNETELKKCGVFDSTLAFRYYYDETDSVSIAVKVNETETFFLTNALNLCAEYYSTVTFDSAGVEIAPLGIPELKKWDIPIHYVRQETSCMYPQQIRTDTYWISGTATMPDLYGKTLSGEAYVSYAHFYSDDVFDLSPLHNGVDGNINLCFGMINQYEDLNVGGHFSTPGIKLGGGEYTLYGILHISGKKKQIITDDASVIHADNCRIVDKIGMNCTSPNYFPSKLFGWWIAILAIAILAFAARGAYFLYKRNRLRPNAKAYGVAAIALLGAVSVEATVAWLVVLHVLLIAAIVFDYSQKKAYTAILTQNSLRSLDANFDGYFDFGAKICSDADYTASTRSDDDLVTVITDRGKTIMGNVGFDVPVKEDAEVDPENPFKNFSFDFPDFSAPPKPLEDESAEPEMSEEELAKLRADLRAGLADVLNKHNNGN